MIDDRKAPQVPRSRRPQHHGPRSSAAVPRCRQGAGALSPADGEAELTVTVAGAHGGTLVAAVTGEIDLRTAEELRARLIELGEELTAAGQGRLVLNFGGVGFCDATGLGALVGAHNHLHARGGEISLAAVRPSQRRLFRITGLEQVFPLYDTVAQAVAAGRTSSLS
ncbi:anti-sigma B factor antagonist [Thermomonospora echinospora]|uniref:Anti-sigma factor antagonist n=1 Tax=Thermomonospora echinospora TaxID=1992 RepID=A0A1H6DXE1_9ACTN|nr:STAS domain-containing protein [Thermomonospora echinospora]SEG89386.1 anti-sigma B factor antagonist [Thermomonospora echinospora]